jgi:hypothetical protein
LFRFAGGVWLAAALSAGALGQQTFDSPRSAAEAVIQAAENHDETQLGNIFGPVGKYILTSGDKAQDRQEETDFAQAARKKYELIPDGRSANRMILSIGDEDWPFPAPLVRVDGKWSFDATDAGVEMLARRIGANELDAVQVCLDYVAAQREYASQARAKDGLLLYASHLSGDGPDDLFRKDDPGMPAGLADAFWQGQKKASKPFHGYYFQVLDGQGPYAPGGAHRYAIRDLMIGGFGLVVWPAEYGETGIETFIVNQGGVVFQKDIPPPSGKGAPPAPVTVFDPDPSWEPVD